jgi:hypothetical protein
MTGQKQFLKFVVFVPVTHTGTVLEAMAGAGAGTIGDYDSCSFVLRGTGRFRPLDGADPFIGEKGKVESVEEDRVEVVVPRDRMMDVLRAAREAHPYEEMAYDIYPLLNHEFME